MEASEIKYDKEIEVTENQYKVLSGQYAGVLFHRRDYDGRCFIKMALMVYTEQVAHVLNTIT